MTHLRRTTGYSERSLEELAMQVGELARDTLSALGTEIALHSWRGIVSFGRGFRMTVGATKPVAVLCVAIEDMTNRGYLEPSAVMWSWQDGQVQVDDMSAGFSAGTEYTVTFLVVRSVHGN